MRSPVPSVALEVDLLQHSVRVEGMPVDLTAVEFGILAALAREPGMVVTRGALLDMVWGPGFADEDWLVDLHVANLRRKLGDGTDLGDVEDRERFVEDVGAFGYRLASID